MPQVTLYFDAETERLMRERAKAAGVSYSKWVSMLIQSKARGEWPAAVRALAGRFQDFPSTDEIRTPSVADAERIGF